MSEIHQTIDTLAQSLQDYQQKNDTKIQELETKTKLAENVQLAKNRPKLGECKMNDHNNETEYKQSFTKYLRSGINNEMEDLSKKSLSTAVESEGGYLVPQLLSNNIQNNMDNLSVIRRLANTMQISTSTVDILLHKKGAEVGWVGEQDTREATDTPEIHKKIIAVHEVYAKPRATQKLLDDAAINIEQWISQSVAQRLAEKENQAFLKGDGDKKPTGILAYPTNINSSWGHFAHIECSNAIEDQPLVEHIIDLFTKLKAEYLANAHWLMSRATLAKIRKLVDKTGRYIWQPSLNENNPANLLGYPVEICDELSSLDDAGEIAMIFGDFNKAYQIIDRQGVHVLRDPYSAKPYVEFYTTKRVGGDVIDFNALVMLKLEQ